MSALTGTAIAALIAGGVSAASSLASAKIGANAAKDAAMQESDAAKQAGAYVQQNTAQNLDYLKNAQSGVQRAPTYQAPQFQGIQVPTPQPVGGAPPPNMGAGLTTQARPAMGAMQPPVQTILVQAPDGSQRRIPAAMQQRAVAAGGKVIG